MHDIVAFGRGCGIGIGIGGVGFRERGNEPNLIVFRVFDLGTIHRLAIEANITTMTSYPVPSTGDPLQSPLLISPSVPLKDNQTPVVATRYIESFASGTPSYDVNSSVL